MSERVKLHWEPNFGAYGGRKSRQAFTYSAYVPDPIRSLVLVLPGDVAEALNVAEVAIRELNAAPPEHDNIENLARMLLRQEAVASSRIEQLEVSHRRLARAAFAAKPAVDVTAESILRNIAAMERAVELGMRATPGPRVADLLALHRELMPGGGHLRTEQNWVGGVASSPRSAEFVPPPPDRVRPLLEDLCAFCTRDDLPAVAQAAIVHAQFETIHPFADGNGRVGRCLIHVMLRRRGLASRYVLPISLILAANSKAYIGGLTEFRDGQVAEWCATFAAAARSAARQAQRFAEEVASLKQAWRARAGEPRKDSAALKVIGALPAHPILDVATAQTLARCSNQAARLAMRALEKAGVIKRINVGRRNRAWEAVGVFELLGAFERELSTRRSYPEFPDNCLGRQDLRHQAAARNSVTPPRRAVHRRRPQPSFASPRGSR